MIVGARRPIARATLAAFGGLFLLAAARSGAEAQHLPDLVTPDVLRVCADPANMPFSNRKGEGFENRIAEVLAGELKVPLRSYWLSQGPGFVRNTLGLKLCDVIIGYAAGTELVQHSNPYYRSVYVLVVRRGDLGDVKQLDDPRLKSKRIGVVAGTPPVDHLARHDLLADTKGYAPLAGQGSDRPLAAEIIADVAAGRLDAAVLWGPAAGYYARASSPELALVPLVREQGRPALSYRITVGLRPDEVDWKRTLNAVLRRRQADIDKILLGFGVPLLDENDNLIPAGEEAGSRR